MGTSVKMTSGEVEDFLENIAYQKLKRLLQEAVGLDCSCYRDEYLKRRFAVRLRATGTNTYSRYLRYVKKYPVEYYLVLDNIKLGNRLFELDPLQGIFR